MSELRDRDTKRRNDEQDYGLFARLLRTRNFLISIVLLILCAGAFGFFGSYRDGERFELKSSGFQFGQEIVAGAAVLIVAYIISYLFLGSDREILSFKEVNRIGDQIAGKVAAAVSRLPLDNSLLPNTLDTRSLIRSASNRICISRETGADPFNECRNEIKAALTSGCRVQIILMDPDSRFVTHVKFRYSSNNKVFESRALTGEKILKDITRLRPEIAEKIEIRYHDFPLINTTLIIDPGTDKSQSICQQVGHLIQSNEERITLNLTAVSSPRVSGVVLNEFERIFQASSKIALISSEGLTPVNDLGRLFPVFSVKQHDTKETPDLVPVENPQHFFIVHFEKDPATDIWWVIHGVASSRGTRTQFTLNGSPPPVSLSGLRVIRNDLQKAIDCKLCILFLNLDEVALGLDGAIAEPERIRGATELLPPEELEFLDRYEEKSTKTLTMSILPAIRSLMDSKGTHLFVHFNSALNLENSDLGRSIGRNLRSSRVSRQDLMGELFGSAAAIRHRVTS